MIRRTGAVSLPELVLVVWLFGFVLLALAALVARESRLAARQRDLVRFHEARRTVEVILGSELRTQAPGDLAPAGPGALRVRGVRGGGPLCGPAGAAIDVRYAGARMPAPGKDSVLVLHAGGEAVRAVLDVAGAANCGPGGLRLAIEPPLPVSGGLALVFESGRYDVGQDALRYALGKAGRQPLTEAVFATGALEALPGRPGWRLHLPLHEDSLRRAPRHLRVVLPMLNPAGGGS